MSDEILHPEDEAAQLMWSSTAGKYIRFVMAVLGVLPWVGSIVAASAALSAEKEQNAFNLTLQRWLEEHEQKLSDLHGSIIRVTQRVEGLGDEARQRLNSEEFLPLARRAYRGWDRAQTEEKRRLFERLLINAAGTRMSDDDVVRLFIDWIDRYDEVHFRIISAVYKNPGISRLGIWRIVGTVGAVPRENSAEADLYRMLMHDLSTGRVLRQQRAVDSMGRFLKKGGTRRRGSGRSGGSNVMKSSFDHVEPYELSELGTEFVRYVLTDAVSRIEGAGRATV